MKMTNHQMVVVMLVMRVVMMITVKFSSYE